MPKPKLLLATKDPGTFTVIEQQLQRFFRDLIEIHNYRETPYSPDVDLVVSSSPQVVGEEIPEEKLIIAKRTITTARLEQLFDIPDDTQCLVVNNLMEKTLESIDQLQRIGFKFKMIPYCTEHINKVDTKNIDTAINFVGEEMVPSHIKHTYHIGRRPLDISTIIEIAVKLNLHTQKGDVSDLYFQHIIAMSKNHFDAAKRFEMLSRQLDGILNTVHEGIISTDEQNKVIQINSGAREILGIKEAEKDLLGRSLEEFLPNLEKKYTETQIYQINSIHLVVNQTKISTNEQAATVTAFRDVTQIQQLEQSLRNKLQAKGLTSKYTYKDIIGSSPELTSTITTLKKIAATDKTVLILGESGTGKELFAHAIHDLSSRSHGPFLPVNFAGLPQSLAESELFGYEEGSFTGAKRGGKQGLFELAHNGTIFLDEVGDAPKELQALLLRVLQEKVVMRVGGHSMIPVNVRVIAATNKDLKKLVEQGLFREDLYYRLFVLPLRIPPLRDRKQDILELFFHFLKENTPTNVSVNDDVYHALLQYSWPGNVRELRSVVQYVSSVMENHTIRMVDLPEQFSFSKDSDASILSRLNNVGTPDEYHIILAALKDAQKLGRKIGRGKIVEFAQKHHCQLTDQQVRTRLNLLRDLHLVSVGTKRQGCSITEEGHNALSVLQSMKSSVKSI